MAIVAITDSTFPSLEIEERILHALGHTVRSGQWKTAEALAPRVADADAVITQFAPVNAAVIAAMAKAKVIVRYGIGVDNVDLAAAKARGIPVCNVPDYCIDEVADHTLAFLLAITRQVVPNCVHIREGRWGLATPMDRMRSLREATVGIVGFGRIGREVAARLKAFKCRVIVCDPVVDPSEIASSGCTPVALGELFAQSDAITLHCPSTAMTRGLVNAQSLAAMKPGVVLINVARVAHRFVQRLGRAEAARNRRESGGDGDPRRFLAHHGRWAADARQHPAESEPHREPVPRLAGDSAARRCGEDHRLLPEGEGLTRWPFASRWANSGASPSRRYARSG